MFIRLHGIKLFAYHGVYDEEIRNGNHFEIDLCIEVPDNLGISDVLTDTIDYTKLLNVAAGVSETRRYNLLEAFASDIAVKILDSFPVIAVVEVKVRKMNPPMGAAVNYVEVEFHKRRTNA